MSRAYAVAADPFVAQTLLRGVPQEEDEEEESYGKKNGKTTNTKKWTKAKDEDYSASASF